MMTKRMLISGLVATAVALGGCTGPNQNEQAGQVIGAIAGGVLGSRMGEGSGKIAATIAGTMLGGYIGGRLGRAMDENDRYRAGQALESAPTGRTVSWRNPDTGNEYAVTPTRTYYEQDRPCREYTTEGWIGGRKETIYGTACRQPDGTWQAAN